MYKENTVDIIGEVVKKSELMKMPKGEPFCKYTVKIKKVVSAVNKGIIPKQVDVRFRGELAQVADEYSGDFEEIGIRGKLALENIRKENGNKLTRQILYARELYFDTPAYDDEEYVDENGVVI
jgi:hypothetical protein